ncbi:tetratricopeptide repeat protein [Gregarina niphandrodes]|uniref:peptidylprolyl isomerase n=1 Tax=Gregarina niphandrodes TaxID=110365 RepID=A0A023B3I1_GRENI|nr:tetratricopeptide repeat protein [Gregarina niphandrodes]EZG55378.1 tetratricopeptide repeat protein [Gregarina niphandrodes]|eukprot:XP_011131602.1 tetratricopeptide repeat protein [Gregarina niphandrodes]
MTADAIAPATSIIVGTAVDKTAEAAKEEADAELEAGEGGEASERAKSNKPLDSCGQKTEEPEGEIATNFEPTGESREGAESREAGEPRDAALLRDTPLETAPDVGMIAADEEMRDGRALFESEKYADALKAWTSRLRSIQYVLDKHKEGEPYKGIAEFEEMALKTCSNIALCNIKLRRWGDAVTFCDRVLELDPRNEKALYRKAKSLFEMAKLTEAYKALATFRSADPAVIQLTKEVNEAIQRTRLMQKKMMQKILEESRIENSPYKVIRLHLETAYLWLKALFLWLFQDLHGWMLRRKVVS